MLRIRTACMNVIHVYNGFLFQKCWNNCFHSISVNWVVQWWIKLFIWLLHNMPSAIAWTFCWNCKMIFFYWNIIPFARKAQINDNKWSAVKDILTKYFYENVFWKRYQRICPKCRYQNTIWPTNNVVVLIFLFTSSRSVVSQQLIYSSILFKTKHIR